MQHRDLVQSWKMAGGWLVGDWWVDGVPCNMKREYIKPGKKEM